VQRLRAASLAAILERSKFGIAIARDDQDDGNYDHNSINEKPFCVAFSFFLQKFWFPGEI